MAEYLENNIILSLDETRLFQQKLNAPNPVATERQNKTLDWISQHLDMYETDEGFCVTISDEALNAEKEASTMATYKYHVEEGFIYSDSFEKDNYVLASPGSAFVNLENIVDEIRVRAEIFYECIKNGLIGTDSTVEYDYNENLGECA